MTNLTGPPSVRASVKLVAEVNPEDLYWQAAIITDKEVALEDYGGDNTTQFTRGSDVAAQSVHLLQQKALCVGPESNYLAGSSCHRQHAVSFNSLCWRGHRKTM